MRCYFTILAGLMLLCCRAGVAVQAIAALLPVEVVKMTDGTYLLRHCSPATAADIDMPVFHQGLVLESFAYHVQDRKRRDVLHYARIKMSTTESSMAVVQYYRGVLEKAMVTRTVKDNGEITLAAGTQDDLRQVTITPQEKDCRILLERVKRYTIPPRIYTKRERHVINVLNSVAQTYQTAQHITYTLEQHYALLSSPAKTQSYSWMIDYHRPNGLQLTVMTGKKKMTIASKEDHLLVVQPDGRTEKRAIAGKITAEILPEIQDDPIARLMLGDVLISSDVDYLALEAIPDSTATQQAELILTFPENHVKLFLFIDLRQKSIVRSEILVTQGNEQQRIFSTYKNVLLDYSAQTGSSPVNALQHQPSSSVPAAVPAP